MKKVAWGHAPRTGLLPGKGVDSSRSGWVTQAEGGYKEMACGWA